MIGNIPLLYYRRRSWMRSAPASANDNLESTMDNTRYYLGFNIVNGIGPARMDRLIERCGSIEAAWRASFADMQAAGLDARRTAALVKAQRTVDLDAEQERADRAGMELVTREHPGYPA